MAWENLPSTNTPVNATNLEAIAEGGSNANGNYIKYQDGTLICYKSVSNAVAITTAWGSLYEGTLDLGSWPATFISAPEVSITNRGTPGAMVESFKTVPTTTSAGEVYLVRPTSATLTFTLSVIAIGRWKA